jgi:hypothetical protein
MGTLSPLWARSASVFSSLAVCAGGAIRLRGTIWRGGFVIYQRGEVLPVQADRFHAGWYAPVKPMKVSAAQSLEL